jgi:hypothetical protein
VEQQACPDLPALSQQKWSLAESNARSYWLIYGHVAMAKSKNTQLTQNRLLNAKFERSSVAVLEMFSE